MPDIPDGPLPEVVCEGRRILQFTKEFSLTSDLRGDGGKNIYPWGPFGAQRVV
jgi:hypothetical protein